MTGHTNCDDDDDDDDDEDNGVKGHHCGQE